VPKFEPRCENVSTTRSPESAVKGKRRVYFCAGGSVDATLYERDKLAVGAILAGPAIVEQFDATTVIPTGWSGRVDGYRNLILQSRGSNPGASS
jgi:N-methylhydantoinase A